MIDTLVVSTKSPSCRGTGFNSTRSPENPHHHTMTIAEAHDSCSPCLLLASVTPVFPCFSTCFPQGIQILCVYQYTSFLHAHACKL